MDLTPSLMYYRRSNFIQYLGILTNFEMKYLVDQSLVRQTFKRQFAQMWESVA